MVSDEIKKLLDDKKRPWGKNSSVHYSETRFDKAREQLCKARMQKENKELKTRNEIAKLVLNFIKDCKIDSKIVIWKKEEHSNSDNYLKEFNNNTTNLLGITNKQDLIWLKFTTSGYLGVVACSNDVNFDIPETKSKKEYNKKSGKKWVYNTSGIIVKELEEKWDDSFILAFPLKGVEKGDKLIRHKIETGVGNYLISKEIPILDYYSHRY